MCFYARARVRTGIRVSDTLFFYNACGMYCNALILELTKH